MTATEKNQLTIQYEPLINRITAQFHKSVKYDWQSIKSMAYEGFALALNNYDENRSSMTFTQYAAFSIRNNILTCLTNETRVVKLPAEEQKKRKEDGDVLFNSISIDQVWDNGNDEVTPKEIRLGMYEEAKFGDGDVFNYLYNRLEENFSQRDCEMFYKTFGLKNFNETPNHMIAKEYGVSEGLISQRKKKIIDYIRQDAELCEMMLNLTK